MTLQEFKQIVSDIASFSDDEYDIVSDMHTGEIIFERGGRALSINIIEDEEGRKFVLSNGISIPYRIYLAKELARLDVLASKMLQHHQSMSNCYVDPMVCLYEQGASCNGKGMDVLSKECGNTALVGSKLCFVTADAGHGKSMLLHEYQHKQAKEYLAGTTNFLFWHIDLHGRDLVRLNEAIMYDLAELRFSGLYYSSILTLIRRHLIILGIDGFDELAAEKGGEGALNSLSNLVSQMQGRGVLVAASRRAFFNSQDFVRRSGLLKRNVGMECVFDELKITNWRKEQCIKYLDCFTYNESDYEQLLSVLKEESHPLLERPYLFTKMVAYSYNDNISPFEFVTLGRSNLESINDIIEAFIYREVDKWTDRNKETGKPYLSFDQHIRLLSEVALEMWHSQKETIALDNLQLILTLLFDEWKIPVDLQPVVIRMVESHAMLVNVEGEDKLRKFDHPEFRNFFLARALQNILEESVKLANFKKVRAFLYIAQLPDPVAQYLSTRLDENNIMCIVNALLSIRKKEWKPSYLQSNIGTLLPFILDNITPQAKLLVSDRITFTSLIFENKSISNLTFRECSFVNVSFKNTHLKDVSFEKCDFTGLTCCNASGNVFDNVHISQDCSISELVLTAGEGEIDREYSPHRIHYKLNQLGIDCGSSEEHPALVETQCATEFYKLVKRLLNKFTKSTCLYESNIQELPIFNFNRPNVVLGEIIPLLVKYDILEMRENKKTRQAGTTAWVLTNYDISEIFLAEDDGSHILAKFWHEVKEHD